jgi:hypothetical protein
MLLTSVPEIVTRVKSGSSGGRGGLKKKRRGEGVDEAKGGEGTVGVQARKFIVTICYSLPTNTEQNFRQNEPLLLTLITKTFLCTRFLNPFPLTEVNAFKFQNTWHELNFH